MSTVSGKMLKSADGTDIYAEAVGDPSKPAVVCIHGFSMCSIAFNAIFNDAKYTDSVYLVRYDVRGHGRSGQPTDAASWESKRLAEDFDAVVEAFGLVKPFVLGWSLGGTFITDILAFHPPNHVAGIIFVAPLPYLGPAMMTVGSPATLALLPGLAQITDVATYQANARTFADLCFAPSEIASDPTFYLACLDSSLIQPRAVTQALNARTQDPSGLLGAGRAGALALLVIFGERDRIVQRQGVMDAVAGEGWEPEKLEVVDLEDAEHFPWISRPEKFREAMLSWVGRVGQGAV